MHVLFVGDDREYAQLIKELLSKSEGIIQKVEWVSSRETALMEITSSRWDVCLIDHSIEELKGIDFLRTIHDRGLKIPVIILCTKEDKGDENEHAVYSMVDYIPRGIIDRDILIRSIKYIVEQKKREEIKISGDIAMHELGNLFTVIQGNIDLLLSLYTIKDDNVNTLLQHIKKAAQRAQGIVKKFNAFLSQDGSDTSLPF